MTARLYHTEKGFLIDSLSLRIQNISRSWWVFLFCIQTLAMLGYGLSLGCNNGCFYTHPLLKQTLLCTVAQPPADDVGWKIIKSVPVEFVNAEGPCQFRWIVLFEPIPLCVLKDAGTVVLPPSLIKKIDVRLKSKTALPWWEKPTHQWAMSGPGQDS